MKKTLPLLFIFVTTICIVATIPLAWKTNHLEVSDQSVGYETIYFDFFYLAQHSFILALDTTDPSQPKPWAVTDYLPKGWYAKVNLEFYPLPGSTKSHVEKDTRLSFQIVGDNGDTFYLPHTDTIVGTDDQPYQKTILLY